MQMYVSHTFTLVLAQGHHRFLGREEDLPRCGLRWRDIVGVYEWDELPRLLPTTHPRLGSVRDRLG